MSLYGSYHIKKINILRRQIATSKIISLEKSDCYGIPGLIIYETRGFQTVKMAQFYSILYYAILYSDFLNTYINTHAVSVKDLLMIFFVQEKSTNNF